jgi:murein L,D-transpeptidase YcbB/YkuD
VTEYRKGCTGRWPVHLFQSLAMAAALHGAAASAHAAPAKGKAAAATKPATFPRAGQSVDDFYAARSHAPLWLGAKSGDGAWQLVALLKSSWIDGLAPEDYQPAQLEAKIAEATRSGKPKAVLEADRALSEAFVAYARSLSRKLVSDVYFVDEELRPKAPTPRGLLLTAASAKSLGQFVSGLGWMNPIYADLRSALIQRKYANERERELLAINLERARSLPGGGQRYILVNAAEQRLHTYENGVEVDSMRVVVGKPKYPTPMMAAHVRFAALNPYWYVPPDLAAERIAPNVQKRGLKYLNELGYEVMNAWDDNAEIIDPLTIDWGKVASGEVEVLIRQKPGPHNSMGRMKFMFPNSAGIYLHDNPERSLFEEASRLYSGGCVRLEDAARLGKWLFGRELEWEGAEPEERVMLPRPVPVYITYLTAMPKDSGIAFFEDVYSRDSAKLATVTEADKDLAAAGR